MASIMAVSLKLLLTMIVLNFCVSASLAQNVTLQTEVTKEETSQTTVEPSPTTVSESSSQQTTTTIPKTAEVALTTESNSSEAKQQTQSSDYQRTVIFIYAQTTPGHHIFLRGGISHEMRPGCTSDAETSNCSIPIQHREMNETEGFEIWKVGDDHLDWYGAEVNQTGVYEGMTAQGSPMTYTTNDTNDTYYNSLNHYGSHYWMIDVDMDCSKTMQNGWFEAKALYDIYWEKDIQQNDRCGGNAGAVTPYKTNNHLLQCGKINVIAFNENTCHIDNL